MVIGTGCTVAIIGEPPDRLFLRCTNCGVLFPSSLRISSPELVAATIEDKHYQCPVCANFDTYGKADLFYDDGGEHVVEG